MKCSECGKTITVRKKKYFRLHLYERECDYEYYDYFCSEECVKKYFELTEDVCSYCGKKITNGLITDATMTPYCSYKCAYNDIGIETIEEKEEPEGCL